MSFLPSTTARVPGARRGIPERPSQRQARCAYDDVVDAAALVVELVLSTQPSIVIAPMVPVWRLRVPGDATIVLSDSVTVLLADAALADAVEDASVAAADDALSVTDADAAFDPSLTPAVPVDAAAEAADALAMIELASAGEMVVVEVELLLLELLDAARTSCERTCCWVSMNAMVGPATTGWSARSTASPFSGCWSAVMKMPTGPSMPSGTTHWSNGSEIDMAAPPTSIWQ